MAHIISYSHLTRGTIPRESWDEAWFTIQSWKGALQSFPGMLSIRPSARELESGDIHFHVLILWEYLEQLEEWRESAWSAEALLRSLPNPAQDIQTEFFEDLG